MEPDTSLMPSILDREIASIEADAFGHRHYAKALKSIVESPSNVPPFSVGLLGDWVTGKSSIKQLYLSSLEDDSTRDRGGHIRNERFHPVTFNAWRYGGGDIKRALLRHVFLDLGGDEDRLKRELFSNIQSTFTERRVFKDLATDFLNKRIFPLLWLAAVVLVVGFAAWRGLDWLNLKVDDR